MKNRKVRIAVILILTLCGLGLMLHITGSSVSVEAIEAFMPKDPWKASAALLIFYGLKSMTVFFPLILIQIAAGAVLPMGAALAVNLAGLVIILTVPYFEAFYVGRGAVELLNEKHSWLEPFIKKLKRAPLFVSFLFRVINCLPGDLVTMYFGATGMPYTDNLLGGILGQLPAMVLATVMGESIRRPGSAEFVFSAALTVLLSLGSYVYMLVKRKEK